MITMLEISGRAIGNSLFSYATLFGVGKKLNLDIRIPKGETHVHTPTGQKIWQLKDIFDIKTPYITQEEIDNIKHTYIEKRKEFNPEIFTEVKNNTDLVGFFQSEMYFKEFERELREQLTFYPYWVEQAKFKFSEMGLKPEKCIALHVRRGDYERLQEFHPVLSLDYYKEGLDYIYNKVGNDFDICVFSDDIDWCKKNIKWDRCHFVENIEDKREILDFVMISLCSNAIIANSTYSLWATWLGNEKQDKIIIAPKLWFGIGYSYGGTNIPFKECVRIDCN